MARLNYIDYFKRALLEFATENDPLYAMLQWMTEKIMQLEAEQKVGAQKGEHSTERATHFSGNRLRRFDTRMGTMYLLVPKLRKGGYIPFYLPGFTATVLGNTGGLAKTGYTFSGWVDANGTAYVPGQTFAMGNTNVTLAAAWTAAPPSIVGSWSWWRAYAKYTQTMQFIPGTPQGVVKFWEDHEGTIPASSDGSWSLTGDTMTLSAAGPGTVTATLTWVNSNQVQFQVPGSPTPDTLYRKGTEPDGYLFNNPKYPPIPLVSGAQASGNMSVDMLALYQYTASPTAQQATFSWSSNAEIWVYTDEDTTFGRWSGSSSGNTVTVTPGHTYSVVLAYRTLMSGDYWIMVTEQ